MIDLLKKDVKKGKYCLIAQSAILIFIILFIYLFADDFDYILTASIISIQLFFVYSTYEKYDICKRMLELEIRKQKCEAWKSFLKDLQKEASKNNE